MKLFGFLVAISVIHDVTGHPPHIIFIVADDLGWNDIGWHNEQMYTPNLDKLAKDGVILNSSYVQPLCTPSRNCFMTGYYPYHTGLQHDVIHPMKPGFLPSNFTTLPQKLKELGYATHMVGKWHLGFCNWKYTPTYRGFDSFMGYYNGMEDYFTHIRTDKLVSGYDFRFNKSVCLQAKHKYSAEIFADRAVDIINRLDPDSQPLYLYLPFQMIHAVDWFPTLLTLAGGKPDINMDGRNQWQTISKGAKSPRTEFVYNIDEIANNSAIRVGRYKLIQGNPGKPDGWAPLPPEEEIDIGNTTYPDFQLFDLERDPGEHFDIASQHNEIVEELKSRLAYHRQTMVPANYPPDDERANPKYFGGNWTPGWC